MKTNANKPAAGAAFPSTRRAAPARSLGATRARLASDDETQPALEKRLKAVAPSPTSKAVGKRKGKTTKVTKSTASTKNSAKTRNRKAGPVAAAESKAQKSHSRKATGAVKPARKAARASAASESSDSKAAVRVARKGSVAAGDTAKTTKVKAHVVGSASAVKSKKTAANAATGKALGKSKLAREARPSGAAKAATTSLAKAGKAAHPLNAVKPGKNAAKPGKVKSTSKVRSKLGKVGAGAEAATVKSAKTSSRGRVKDKNAELRSRNLAKVSRARGVGTTAVAAAQGVPHGASAVGGERTQAAATTEKSTSEVRTAPAVSPSAPSTHSGRGDATLARYMSELATYELLGRDDEIRLAQEVESLEVQYWRAMLSMPRAVAPVEHAILSILDQPPSALSELSRAAEAVIPGGVSKAAATRYEQAVEAAAKQLREVDIHRDAAKASYAALHDLSEGWLAKGMSVTEIKAVERFMCAVGAARRAQQAAKDRFVAANLRLVVSMARRYAREGRMPLADLIQEGNLGLMKAVERFDHRRGFRFSTYASWWIRHALTRGLADKGRLVRLPVHALETRTRLARATRKLTCRTGVAPTLDELAAETGLARDKLPAMEELSTEAPFSLDAPVGGDNDRTFLDMLRYEDQASAEDSVVSASHKESLVSLMDELSPFEAQILRYRYGFDGGEERTLKEIGQMYNLSRERIRQIQACALAKMRARVEDEEATQSAAS